MIRKIVNAIIGWVLPPYITLSCDCGWTGARGIPQGKETPDLCPKFKAPVTQPAP